MLVIVFQNLADEFMFVMVYRFDDEPVVTGEIKKRAGLPRRTKFRKDVLLRQRQEVIGGVKMEALLA